MPPLSHIFGRFGEHLASRYLLEQHFRIIHQRYSTRFGEIDIIAQKANKLIFIEVKTRFQSGQIPPEESFSAYKQKRLFKAIWIYLHRNKLHNTVWQADLITIHITYNGIDLRHWANVGEEME